MISQKDYIREKEKHSRNRLNLPGAETMHRKESVLTVTPQGLISIVVTEIKDRWKRRKSTSMRCFKKSDENPTHPLIVNSFPYFSKIQHCLSDYF